MNTGAHKIFMLGIGGMGMLPLALYVKAAGNEVWGYDDEMSERVRMLLTDNGIKLTNTLAAAPLDPETTVVYSSAISEKHPFYTAARQKGLPLIRRGHFLAQCVQNKRLIAIVGSHGKTSTTAWLVHLWKALKIDFSYLLGGLFKQNAHTPGYYSPTAEWVVAEIDESDGTIDAFSPEVTIVVNYDWDHSDRYTSEEVLKHTFVRLLERTRSLVLLPHNETFFTQSQGHFQALLQTFGPSSADMCADVQDNDGCVTVTLGKGFDGGTYPLGIGGCFNGSNAFTALAATQLIWKRTPTDALKNFPGVQRRQDVLLQTGQWNVLSDYAHHPNEIKAFLQFAKSAFKGPYVIIFQPHRYTRTRQFAVDFAKAFKEETTIFLLPVYAASEEPLPDGTSEAIQAYLPQAKIIPSLKATNSTLAPYFSSPATLLFIGAGDIEKEAHRFTADLKQAIARSLGNEVQIDEPMGSKTTFGIGGKAAFYAQPQSLEALCSLVKKAHDSNITTFFLGRGSNLLVGDEGFDGLVIHLDSYHWGELKLLDNHQLWVGAGAKLKAIAHQACELGWSGFEFLDGIPGTLGGALAMNAGAMGNEIFEYVVFVHAINGTGQVCILERSQLQPIYRSCPQLQGYGIIGAVMKKLKEDTPAAIRSRMELFAQKRKEAQPNEPSAGCIFQNPPGNSAGKLLDELQLKGTHIGGAFVSSKHANFIINANRKATAGDVVQLIRHLKYCVSQKKGIDLKTEVVYLGKKGRQAVL